MTRRSIVAAISICVHAIVLLVVMTADLWRPVSEWPMPRSAMAFVDPPRPIHIEDIPARRTASRSRTPSTPELTSPVAAPVLPPETIGPETLQSPLIVIEPERGGGGSDFGFNNLGPPSSPPPPVVAPPPTPQTPIRLHSGIRAPQRIVNVTPAYPTIARAAHIEGVVIIEATIDERGNVVRTQVLRSIAQLDAAAVDAVRQWKFSPTLLNGVAVPIVMTVTVNFRLD
jgi:periplasmic protein TonB